MGNGVGVWVASTSVGKVVPVGGGVSVGGNVGGVGGEEQEIVRRNRKDTCTARTLARGASARECRWERITRETID